MTYCAVQLESRAPYGYKANKTVSYFCTVVVTQLSFCRAMYLMNRHRKAQDLLYELGYLVPHYDSSPGMVRTRSLPAILLIVTYLIQPFWRGAMTTKAQKNAMCSTLD